jgi:hypothetical protein
MFEAHRLIIQPRLHASQLTEQVFRGCMMLSQIPKRPNPKLSRKQQQWNQQRLQQKQMGTAAKRSRTDAGPDPSAIAPSPTLFIVQHKFWSNASWSGVVFWDVSKSPGVAAEKGGSNPSRLAKLQLTVFRSKAAPTTDSKVIAPIALSLSHSTSPVPSQW